MRAVGRVLWNWLASKIANQTRTRVFLSAAERREPFARHSAKPRRGAYARLNVLLRDTARSPQTTSWHR
jgi:hypothetical protein